MRRAQSRKSTEGLYGCRSEVILKLLLNSFQLLFISILLSVSFCPAQKAGTPARPILVGVVVGKSQEPAKEPAVAEAVRPPRGNDIELRAFEMMNARRLLVGLRPLVWSDDLAELARLHSRNMASGKFFSHKDLDGWYVDDRAARLGIFNWIAIGENIAYLKGFPDPAVTAVEKWMNSPSHKQNILNQRWSQTAIGIAVSEDGAIYFTQVFIER